MVPFHKALSQQLVVRKQHHGAGYVKLVGQVTARRQTLAGMQTPHQNRFPQPMINLPRQRFASLRKWYHKRHCEWSFVDTTKHGIVEL